MVVIFMLYKSLWVVEDKDIYKTLLNYSNNIRNYKKGSFIYKQGDEETNLFFLLNGRIKTTLLNIDGMEKTLAIHESGSFFGETAFFDKQPCHANTLALVDSEVLVFNKDQFLLLIKEQPNIMYELFQSLGRKIRLLSFQVEYLSFMKIEQRVAALLLSFFVTSSDTCIKNGSSSKKKCGSCTEGHILKLKVTDQALADMIGTRREAVTKAISSLRTKGLIDKEDRMICCPDLSKLKNTLLENAPLSDVDGDFK